MHKEVVEDFSFAFNLGKIKRLAANLTNPSNLTNPLNLTNRFNFSKLQRLKYFADDKHFNFTTNSTSAVQQLKDMSSNFLPGFVDLQQEYYDSGKVVRGSWLWSSCNEDHMEKCSAMGVHGCCCKSGFAFVEGNAGIPIAKGAAAGAAAGGVITGALLGGDVGASTASGAASGALGGVVQYALESGKCNPKEHLSKSVQSHLS